VERIFNASLRGTRLASAGRSRKRRAVMDSFTIATSRPPPERGTQAVQPAAGTEAPGGDRPAPRGPRCCDRRYCRRCGPEEFERRGLFRKQRAPEPREALFFVIGNHDVSRRPHAGGHTHVPPPLQAYGSTVRRWRSSADTSTKPSAVPVRFTCKAVPVCEVLGNVASFGVNSVVGTIRR